LIALQKASVGLPKGGGDRGKKSPGGVPTLNEAGIDKDLAKLARKLAKLTDAQFEALLAGRQKASVGLAKSRPAKRSGEKIPRSLACRRCLIALQKASVGLPKGRPSGRKNRGRTRPGFWRPDAA
jgi:hypothetical protein